MKTVLVPLAEGCEEMEAITITDILTRAGAKVITAGLTEGPVKASRGANLLPDTTLSRVLNESFDLIVLPGGLPGAHNLAENQQLIQMIIQRHEEQRLISAVCAAPRVLAIAGILNGTTITSYPGSLADLNETWINTGNAIEIDGHIVTGRGPGVVLDFSLCLVEQLFDRENRNKVEAALAR
jgi:4-methyl-5(b-hydroxyethyl)-thiazole monophosphate biosynthesis